MRKKKNQGKTIVKTEKGPTVVYKTVLKNVLDLINDARRFSARTINTTMTATYWEIGRRVIKFEQSGKRRAGYGEELLKKLSYDLTRQLGRGFSERNLRQMRQFYLNWPIRQTLSAKSSCIQKQQTVSAVFNLQEISKHFQLPWSAYVLLMAVKDVKARKFYEEEALRGGWSIRQLDRQVNSMFYERMALSKNKTAMLTKGAKAKPDDMVIPETEVKDPYVLEFLSLKDEYSESDLEEALILHLENFLLELGSDFAFIGRQKRLRIDDEWYRVDLVFFHRRLKCLIIIDLKIGKFTHADAGQMHMYLNYASEHWMRPEENPPVGLILCAQKNDAVAKYALKGLPNKVLAAEYKTALPDEKLIAAELNKTRKMIERRKKRI